MKVMDVRNIEVDLQPDRKPEDPYNSTFDWNGYSEKCGIYPSNDWRLFRHADYIEQTVFERICAKNLYVFIKHNQSFTLAQIQLAVGDQLQVDTVKLESRLPVWIDSDLVVKDIAQFERLYDDIPEREKKFYPFVDIKLLDMYKDKFQAKLCDILQTGQFFEIQDPSDPTVVHFGEVKHNMGGLILYKYVGTDKIASTHILDPFCHAIGWQENGYPNLKVKYHERYSIQDLIRCKQNPVAPLFFESFKVTSHEFTVGMLVEVQDRGVGRAFFPGHISKILNDYFFEVTTRTLDSEDPYTFVAHKSSEGIFPVGYSEKYRYPLFPSKWSEYNDNDAHDDIWDKYVEYNKIKHPYFTDSDQFPLQSNGEPIAPLRFIEIFCHIRGCMYSAIITATSKRAIWALPGQEYNTSALHHYVIGSMCIFPCGYAARYNIPIVGEPIVPTFKNGVADRFQLTKYYRSVPGPIFSRKDTNIERFLPSYYLKGDNWIPTVYVKLDCFHERFPKFSLQRASHYPPGPMLSIIKMIAKDFYLSCSVWFRDQIRDLFNCSTDFPNVIVKHRWRSEHISLRVPSCEKAYQFPAWLAIMLRVLGCCPNFLSLKRNAKCPGNCQSRHVMDVDMRKRGVDSPGPRTLDEARNLYSKHQATRFSTRPANENHEFLNLLVPPNYPSNTENLD